MRYPYVSRSACSQLANQKVAGEDPSIDARTQWLGAGPSIDLRPIEDVAEQAVDLVRRHRDETDRDRLEGQMAGRVFDALDGVPIEILDDPGFWRYLSLALFWDFIAWREEGAFKKGNHLKYVECEASAEAVLPRMYLRAGAVGGRGYYTLASALPKSTDFWRSHVIRVQTGRVPDATRALVRAQLADRLVTERLRELARGLTRTWSNVVPYLYKEPEARQLIEELRASIIDDTEGS